MASLENLKFRCKACKDVREDKDISVRVIKDTWESGVVVRENFQYCNDRKECKRVAQERKGYGT